MDRVAEHRHPSQTTVPATACSATSTPTTGPVLAAAGIPSVTFNYEGRFDRPESVDWSSAADADTVFANWGSTRPAHYALSVFARTADHQSGPVLTADWHTPEGVLDPAAVEDLAATWLNALTAIADH